MNWFVLALIAPLIFAVINLIDDHMLKNVYRSPHAGTIISSIFGGLPLISLFFLETKAIPLRLAALSMFAGFSLSIMYYNYFRSFETESPSVIVAILGTSPVILAVAGYFFLDERLSSQQIAGAGIVLIASVLLVIRRKEKWSISSATKSLALAVIAASLNAFLAKFLFERADFYTVYIHMCLGLVIGGVYFMLYLLHSSRRQVLRELRKSFRHYLPLYLLTEGLAIAAEFTSALAVSRGPVSIVRSVENVQPMFVFIIALALYPFRPASFREAAEDGKLRKFMLLIIILIGLYLIGETVLV